MLAIPRRKKGIFVSLLPDMPICPLPQKWFWVKRFSKFVNWLSQLCKARHIWSDYNLDTCKGRTLEGGRANVVRTCPQTGQKSKLRYDRARCWKEAYEDPPDMCSDPYCMRYPGRHLPHRNTWFISLFELSLIWGSFFCVMYHVLENPG